MTQGRRRRSAAVPISLTMLLAATLTACGAEEEPDVYAVCVDPRTEERLDDDQCGDDEDADGGFAWYYFGGINSGRTYVAPPVGAKVSGGTTTKPSGSVKTQYGGVSKSGGTIAKGSPTVSRGGFSSGGKGGFGG